MYFVGNLPSKKVKYRPDIPDSFVLAALKEIAIAHGTALFVANDQGQRTLSSEFKSVECFIDLDTLIKSSQIQPLIEKWKFDQKWHDIQKKLPNKKIIEEIKQFVSEESRKLLSWSEVKSDQIPEDNNTATISTYGEPEEIEIDGPEDWGGGLLRYRATFFSECLIQFSIFRGDAFHAPEWIMVTLGDFVEDHYFDAEGYVVVMVSVDVTVRISVDPEPESDEDWISEISLDKTSLELSIPGP